MKIRNALVASFFLLFTADLIWPQEIVFNKVKTRFSKTDKDRRLRDKEADLIFDDGMRKLTVKNAENPLGLTYDEIQRVVFDVSTHMRGGAVGQMVGAVAGAPGLAISSAHVNDYWCYIEHRGTDGVTHSYLLEIDKGSSQKVIDKMRALFGEKVTIADFPEKESKIEKDTLKDLQSKHDLNVDRKNHPLPEIIPGKALLVVVCPPLAALFEGKSYQFKIHANDHVVGVNKWGTYTFFYLDPGEYMLVSQTENASGFKMKLEAAKDYYFLQDTFMGFAKPRTTLSRHTRELVMYELNGAYYSDWKRK